MAPATIPATILPLEHVAKSVIPAPTTTPHHGHTASIALQRVALTATSLTALRLNPPRSYTAPCFEGPCRSKPSLSNLMHSTTMTPRHMAQPSSLTI
ncbi:unnamed protein product [Prunus armeniaca]